MHVQRSQETGSLDSKKEALKELYNTFIGTLADWLHGDQITMVLDGLLAFVPFPQSSTKILGTFPKPSEFD